MPTNTLNEMYFETTQKYRKPNCFLYKKGNLYQQISTADFIGSVRDFSLGLTYLGVGKQDKVALLSYNRPEWAIADYAILILGGVTVPIYTVLPANQCEYILNDCGAKVIIVEDAVQLKKIIDIKNNLKNLRYIISLEEIENQPDVYNFSHIIELGKKVNPELHKENSLKVTSEDLATLVYTSGTTGIPKGVMLSHKNIVSNVLAVSEVLKFSPEDIALSFLPLSHIFERTVDYILFYNGVTIAYAESAAKVVKNIKEIRPTVLAGVPRFYEIIYTEIMHKVSSVNSLKRFLFRWAMSISKKYYDECMERNRSHKFLYLKYALMSRFVFNKLRKALGGRIRFLVSGGAPLAKEVSELFFAGGLPILEGYGLTETSPVISVNTETAFRIGTVGKPIPDLELKVAPDGEILVRGQNVMEGYYNKPSETDSIIKDGWFYTGDIGEIDCDGFLKITDRKKDLIKTSSGKYVAPQPIETKLKASPYIANALVVGDKQKFCSAILVPNLERLKIFARENGIKCANLSDLLKTPEIKRLFKLEINKVNSALAPFETIKNFALLESDFTIEANELTPTLKIRRKVIEEKFKDLINSLYVE